ncbi:MAG: hypothetical protein A2Y38_19520 [Spirochaetes bacterium GWB1_59_5]|nr:MAG: hypothetical protein A2Y38_19520 [Spirochaetes bacterium GWB1_59_5]
MPRSPKKPPPPDRPTPENTTLPLDTSWLRAHRELLIQQYETAAKELQYQLTSSEHMGIYNIHLHDTLRRVTFLYERVAAHTEVLRVAAGHLGGA